MKGSHYFRTDAKTAGIQTNSKALIRSLVLNL